MSLIRLETYVVSRDGLMIHGKSTGETTDGKQIVEIQSARMPHGCRAPQTGLMMLYGFRDNLDEMVKQKAIMKGGDPTTIFHPVALDFEVGDIFQGVVQMGILDQQRFLNIKRTSSEIQKHIRARFEEYMKNDKKSLEGVRRIQQIARRPDLFERLVEEPPFNRVEIIVIPVAMDAGKEDTATRQFAYVTKRAKLVGVSQNPESNLIAVVPGWITYR